MLTSLSASRSRQWSLLRYLKCSTMAAVMVAVAILYNAQSYKGSSDPASVPFQISEASHQLGKSVQATSMTFETANNNLDMGTTAPKMANALEMPSAPEPVPVAADTLPAVPIEKQAESALDSEPAADTTVKAEAVDLPTADEVPTEPEVATIEKAAENAIETIESAEKDAVSAEDVAAEAADEPAVASDKVAEEATEGATEAAPAELETAEKEADTAEEPVTEGATVDSSEKKAEDTADSDNAAVVSQAVDAVEKDAAEANFPPADAAEAELDASGKTAEEAEEDAKSVDTTGEEVDPAELATRDGVVEDAAEAPDSSERDTGTEDATVTTPDEVSGETMDAAEKQAQAPSADADVDTSGIAESTDKEANSVVTTEHAVEDVVVESEAAAGTNGAIEVQKDASEAGDSATEDSEKAVDSSEKVVDESAGVDEKVATKDIEAAEKDAASAEAGVIEGTQDAPAAEKAVQEAVEDGATSENGDETVKVVQTEGDSSADVSGDVLDSTERTENGVAEAEGEKVVESSKKAVDIATDTVGADVAGDYDKDIAESRDIVTEGITA